MYEPDSHVCPHGLHRVGSDRFRRRLTGLLALGLLLLGTSPAIAIVAGQLDDFQDATLEGWQAGRFGAEPPVPPAVIANAGPAGSGDFALRITSTGAPIGAGRSLVINNDEPQWIGDYTAAGVEDIMLDVNNLNAFPLTIRVGVEGSVSAPAGGRWVSDGDGAVVAANSGWVTLTLSIRIADLLPGDAGATDPADTLANVGNIRILHSATAKFTGDAVAGQVDVDNIEAVPEPGLSMGLMLGAAWIGSLVSWRRSC